MPQLFRPPRFSLPSSCRRLSILLRYRDRLLFRSHPCQRIRRLLFPYAAANHVFSIMDLVWGKAMIGLHIGICVVNIVANLLSFYMDGDQGGFWTLVCRVTQFLCYVFTTFIMCALISYYMLRVDGEYHELQPAPAAAAELLLQPPLTEMDMC